MGARSDSETGKMYALILISAVSCSMLMYEILLTRVCALRLFFHFGFLIVSNCMLGIGASGSFMSVLQGAFVKRERIWLWRFSLLYFISLFAVYYYLVTHRIEPGINFRSAGEVINFALYNFVAAIPFFFAGCVIVLILTFNAEKVNKFIAWICWVPARAVCCAPFSSGKQGPAAVLSF